MDPHSVVVTTKDNGVFGGSSYIATKPLFQAGGPPEIFPK